MYINYVNWVFTICVPCTPTLAPSASHGYNDWLCSVFSEVEGDAENQSLPPLYLLGCICGAGHPPGSGVAFAPLPFPRGPMGRKRDQSMLPHRTRPQLPGRPAMDEQIWGPTDYTGSLFPLPSLHRSPVCAGAAQPGAPLGVALLGKGGWL